MLDAPEELVGTALPDWVRAAAGRVRIVAERVDATTPLGAGVQRHLRDDAAFHTSPVFRDLSREVARSITALHPERRRVRAWFFGHVLVEMLLDAALMETDPGALDRYYAALDAADVRALLERATPWLDGPAPRLELVATRFRDSRFLYGYRTDEGLAARLAGTAARAGVPVPDGIEAVLPAARRLVSRHLGDLLS